MRDLLETLRKTLLDIGNFGLLLLLFMFIYVLVGAQFFANRFRFGEDGKAIGIGEEGYYTAEVPRSNFDSFLLAFVTVFEASVAIIVSFQLGSGREIRKKRALPLPLLCFRWASTRRTRLIAVGTEPRSPFLSFPVR